jgi:hypothetical protein
LQRNLSRDCDIESILHDEILAMPQGRIGRSPEQ